MHLFFKTKQSNPTNDDDDDDGVSTSDKLRLLQATVDDVLCILKGIDTSKASGPDLIPGRLLKECANEIAPSLTQIINYSLCIGALPREWKLANVLPIFKKGDVNDVINYRPISLLSLVEKVVERVVCNKFYPFVENRIYHLQHGFMKGCSTVTQLLAIVHQLSKSIDERGQTDIAYLDFTKAFNCFT